MISRGSTPQLQSRSPRSGPPGLLTPIVVLSFCSLLIGLAALAARATEPVITLIEKFSTSQVLIHFDTDPGRTYYLQYSGSLESTNWSNLYTGFNYPFFYHYVVPDTRTNSARFYRLWVTTP